MPEIFKKRILIDLDGVLNKYGQEPYNEKRIPDIKEGAKDFLKELNKYAELYLFTSRNLMYHQNGCLIIRLINILKM